MDKHTRFQKLLQIQKEQQTLNRKIVVEGWTMENTKKQEDLNKQLEAIHSQ